MKKKLFTAVIAGVMAMAMSMTALAAGWQKNDTGWWYATNDAGTQWHANGWQWIDGNGDGTAECYYFDGNGYMLAGTTTPDGYEVNADGAWVSNGTVQTKSVAANANNGVAATSTGESRPTSKQITQYLRRGLIGTAGTTDEYEKELFPIDTSKPEWENGVTNIKLRKSLIEDRFNIPENGGYYYLSYTQEDYQAIALNKDGYLLADTTMADGLYVNKYGVVEIDGREVRHNAECLYLVPQAPTSDRNHTDPNALRYQDWAVGFQWQKYVFPCGELIYNHFRGFDKTDKNNPVESHNDFGVCTMYGHGWGTDYPSYRENPDWN